MRGANVGIVAVGDSARGGERIFLDGRDVVDGLRSWADVYEQVGNDGAANGLRRVAEDLEFKLVMVSAF